MNRKTQIILLKTRDGDFECLSIEMWGQFHHYFTRSFYTRRSQKLLDLTAFFALSVPGVNFNNILRAAFTRSDPKSAKKLLDLTVFFALLVPAHVKPARKHVDEIDPWPALVFVHKARIYFISLSTSN